MLKPKRLQPGDKAAIVSLSSGMGGDPMFFHRYELGVKRLEEVFGLEVIAMPNALKGSEYLYDHPEARADDLMQAFRDPEISAVISMIGGDDTIRLLPHIDLDVIRNNPKIFMGYSDTTSNHFMMYKAGLVSFYGPSVLAGFAENVALHSYTREYVEKVLFEAKSPIDILPAKEWTSAFLEWSEPKNNDILRPMVPNTQGFELLQGNGVVSGRLIGGCADVMPMIIGTSIWPDADQWKGAILFLETSEEYPEPKTIKYLLRGLGAQGILSALSGIIMGKPKDERYYDEYKDVLLQVVGREAMRPDLPIVYNVNFGHTDPMCILPYGVMAQIDCSGPSIRLLESGVCLDTPLSL